MEGEAINPCSWPGPALSLGRELCVGEGDGALCLAAGHSSSPLSPTPNFDTYSPETRWVLRLPLRVGLGAVCTGVEEVLLLTSPEPEFHIWTLAREWILLCSRIKGFVRTGASAALCTLQGS